MEVRVQNDTVLIGKVAGHEVAGFLIAAADGSLMGLRGSRAQGCSLPVVAFAQLSKFGIGNGAFRVYLAAYFRPFAGIQQVYLFTYLLPAQGVLVFDIVLPLLPAFGGDDDDPIGASRTIDGGSRYVFQHFDGFDVVGVDGCQRVQAFGNPADACRSGRGIAVIVDNDPVHHIERLIPAGDGVAPANTDAGSGTGLSGTLRHVQPRYSPAEQVVERGGQLRQRLFRYRCNSPRQLFPLLRTVTDDNHLVQQPQILAQLNRNRLRVFIHRHIQGLIPDVSDRKSSRKRRHLNRELPVCIGYCPRLPVQKRHLRPDNRLMRPFIQHPPLNPAPLRKGRQRKNRNREHPNKSS
ncbi:hypothetical protein Barb6_02291 [Bacteroidales bacterium Barb6]|nr:hypothetical protein Barb6_02291 [Bacteroidales bacterium Barb6]